MDKIAPIYQMKLVKAINERLFELYHSSFLNFYKEKYTKHIQSDSAIDNDKLPF